MIGAELHKGFFAIYLEALIESLQRKVDNRILRRESHYKQHLNGLPFQCSIVPIDDCIEQKFALFVIAEYLVHNFHHQFIILLVGKKQL